MLTPAYAPKGSSVAPDVYAALVLFVRAYALAGSDSLPDDNVYRGWENRAALPTGSNDFAVVTILSTTRRGTTVEDMPGTDAPDDQPETYRARTYYEVTAQVDVCANTDVARQRAYSLETVFRSSIGTDFFSRYGITSQYCDSVREMVFVDESKQYVKRYSIDFHLAYWAGVDVDSAWLIDADIQRVEDVDAHHKPT